MVNKHQATMHWQVLACIILVLGKLAMHWPTVVLLGTTIHWQDIIHLWTTTHIIAVVLLGRPILGKLALQLELQI